MWQECQAIDALTLGSVHVGLKFPQESEPPQQPFKVLHYLPRRYAFKTQLGGNTLPWRASGDSFSKIVCRSNLHPCVAHPWLEENDSIQTKFYCSTDL